MEIRDHVLRFKNHYEYGYVGPDQVRGCSEDIFIARDQMEADCENDYKVVTCFGSRTHDVSCETILTGSIDEASEPKCPIPCELSECSLANLSTIKLKRLVLPNRRVDIRRATFDPARLS